MENLQLEKATYILEFMTEPLAQVSGLRSDHHFSSDTWRSVIEQQVDLVQKANIEANSSGLGWPVGHLGKRKRYVPCVLNLLEAWLTNASNLSEQR